MRYPEICSHPFQAGLRRGSALAVTVERFCPSQPAAAGDHARDLSGTPGSVGV